MNAGLSPSDQLVYKKISGSKRKALTLDQIQQSLPGMQKRAVQTCLTNLDKLQLITVSQAQDGSMLFHSVEPGNASKSTALTQDQKQILGIVASAGQNGIELKAIKTRVGMDMALQSLRKLVDGLEKQKLIKSFKSVQSATVKRYLLPNYTPPESMTGGIWYTMASEWDSNLVDVILEVLLRQIKELTYPSKGRGQPPNTRVIGQNIDRLPTPYDLYRHLKRKSVLKVKIKREELMQALRALILNGDIEAIRPNEGVGDIPDRWTDDESSDDDDRPSKRAKMEHDDDLDDDTKRRNTERAKEKAKAKAKELKKREKIKAKEKERKDKQAKKDKDKRKRDKARKKKHQSPEEVVSDADSEPLVAIQTLESGAPKPKTKKKGIRSTSSASGSDSGAVARPRAGLGAGSDAGSGAESDNSGSDSSDSGSIDSDISVSSVDSDDLEAAANLRKRRRQFHGNGNGDTSSHLPQLQSLNGVNDELTDYYVRYRAVSRISLSLGHTEAPCGRCPQFNFCEDDGPVNPVGCEYLRSWLADEGKQGWDDEGRRMYWSEERFEDAEEEQAQLQRVPPAQVV